jgi:hypothetical protein
MDDMGSFWCFVAREGTLKPAHWPGNPDAMEVQARVARKPKAKNYRGPRNSGKSADMSYFAAVALTSYVIHAPDLVIRQAIPVDI